MKKTIADIAVGAVLLAAVAVALSGIGGRTFTDAAAVVAAVTLVLNIGLAAMDDWKEANHDND